MILQLAHLWYRDYPSEKELHFNHWLQSQNQVGHREHKTQKGLPLLILNSPVYLRLLPPPPRTQGSYTGQPYRIRKGFWTDPDCTSLKHSFWPYAFTAPISCLLNDMNYNWIFHSNCGTLSRGTSTTLARVGDECQELYRLHHHKWKPSLKGNRHYPAWGQRSSVRITTSCSNQTSSLTLLQANWPKTWTKAS